jgi:uncharacterized protein (TIRG00374 family)
LLSPKYVSVRKSFIFMIVGLAVFVVYLLFFVGPTQIAYVLAHINSTQYAIYYSLAIVTVLISFFFSSAAWNSILKSLSVNISYGKTYLYYWVGTFTDLVVPCATVCGELTRLYLVQKDTNASYGSIGASAVTNRLAAYAVVTTGLYVGSAFILFKPNVPPIISNVFIFLIVGASIYLAALLVLAFYKGAASAFAKAYYKLNMIFRPSRCSEKFLAETEESLAKFYDGFTVFREKPRRLIRPLLLHSTAYILGLTVFVLVFYALGIPAASPGFYIAIYFISTAFQDASASFSVGSLEILLATIFILYGINSGISGIAAVVLRSTQFWLPLLAGFICVQYMGARNLAATKLPEESRKTLEERKITGPPIIFSEKQASVSTDLAKGKVFKMASEEQEEKKKEDK